MDSYGDIDKLYAEGTMDWHPPEEFSDWSRDPHRHHPDPHWRLYIGLDEKPCVICVQDFDYLDYDARRIISPVAFRNKEEALDALKYRERLQTKLVTYPPGVSNLLEFLTFIKNHPPSTDVLFPWSRD